METQYIKKYFLTGFMLISSIIIYATMIFVMLFISALITAYGTVFTSAVVMAAIILSYFYVHYKFEQEQNITKLALYYALSICLLGILIPAAIYLVIIGGYLIAYIGNTYVSNLAWAIVFYFIYSELFSMLALFSIGFELKELESKSFKFNYILTSITVAVIYLVLNGFAIESFINIIVMCLFILGSTYYVLNGVVNRNPFTFETIEERYRFVINSLTHAAIAPINIPFCMVCNLKQKLKK